MMSKQLMRDSAIKVNATSLYTIFAKIKTNGDVNIFGGASMLFRFGAHMYIYSIS